MNYKEIQVMNYMIEKYSEKKYERLKNKRIHRKENLKTEFRMILALFLLIWALFIVIQVLWHIKKEEIKIELLWEAYGDYIDEEPMSIKDSLGLWECRNIQLEEEHIHHGWMYAFDVACIRGQSFDVKAPLWKNVYEVRAVWYDSRMGNHIILKHGEYWFVFGHTETLLKKWDRVYPGDQIGRVDKSWITQNYHLHFEVWKNDYNISYKVMYWEEPVYNMEKTYKLRKQRGWYLWEAEAMDFIADFEWFRKCSYDDWKQWSIWYWTISFPGECISKEEAKKRKLEEVARLMENVYKKHFVDNHSKRIALVSATYNLWMYSSITRVKHRNTEEWICNYFEKFSKAWGVVLKWLKKRRSIECDVYNGNQKV